MALGTWLIISFSKGCWLPPNGLCLPPSLPFPSFLPFFCPFFLPHVIPISSFTIYPSTVSSSFTIPFLLPMMTLAYHFSEDIVFLTHSQVIWEHRPQAFSKYLRQEWQEWGFSLSIFQAQSLISSCFPSSLAPLVLLTHDRNHTLTLWTVGPSSALFFFFQLASACPEAHLSAHPSQRVTSETVRGTMSLLAHHLHFVFASLWHLCVDLILCTSSVVFLVSSLVEYRVVIEPWIYGARNDSV